MAKYICINQLKRQQNRLQLDLIKYNLDEQWQSHELVAQLRSKILPKLPKGLYDPQDLEHQVLFRLTTFVPDDITDEVIDTIIREQLAIIEERLKDVPDREYLFRGLDAHSKDLNVNNRLELKHDKDRIYAANADRVFGVEFKKITDDKMIKLFTEKLHYIHSGRHNGDAFGLFFKGDDIPWGVETIEPSVGAKQYKRDALLAHGIDPNKAVEITRLYLLPGSPKNAISILDGLVAEYYKERGIEAMHTTTMPTYAKTKSATIAGGMKDVLLVKELHHIFRKSIIAGKACYIHDVNVKNESSQTIRTNPMFPTLLTVETFMRLNGDDNIEALKILDNKTIYISDQKRNGIKSTETKFHVTDIAKTISLLSLNGHYSNSLYIRDTFWGYKDKPKLRLRESHINGRTEYDVSCKYRVSNEEYIRTTVTDLLYRGPSENNAVSEIKIMDELYKRENSYEKVQIRYEIDGVNANIDVYPFGAFLKLKGEKQNIWSIAELLGYDEKSAISKHVDDSYIEWTHNIGLKELWNIRFGLSSNE